MRFYSELRRLNARSRIRLALSARPLYGYKVILDYHGRIPEEYVFLGKGGTASLRALEWLEKSCVQRANHIFAVSEKLQQYLQERYRVEASRLSVIPCCADGGAFRWDPDRREALRAQLGLANKFVCTHVGSFFEWYEPELLLKAFKSVQNSVPAAHLLVLTSDVSAAEAFLSSRLPREAFSTATAPHRDVPSFLNASDLGFLLLRPSPNIKTSSPAKFSEYLNCGLPVMITAEVGDFSELVGRTGSGTVVNRNAEFDPSILSKVVHDRTGIANRCESAGRHLTWAAHTQTWEEIVSKLT
jgi:glycosyltransferase involved in cell wall biosynthesis